MWPAKIYLLAGQEVSYRVILQTSSCTVLPLAFRFVSLMVLPPYLWLSSTLRKQGLHILLALEATLRG